MVYIGTPYADERPLWAANGIVTPHISTDQVLEALGFSLDEEHQL